MPSAESTSPRRLMGGGYTPHEVRGALRLIVIAWLFGAMFSAITTGGAFTSLLKQFLHVDDLEYGLIMAAGPAAGVFLFLGSYAVERTGHMKRIFLPFVTAHRLLWLAVALTPWFPVHLRGIAIAIAAFMSAASANFGGAASWPAWMAGIVPSSIAGRFFGYRARLGLVSMSLASLLVAFLLDRYHMTAWMYATAFGAAAILGAIDILLFIPIREAPLPVDDPPPTLMDIVRTPWSDPLFRGFALYTAVSWVAYQMMGPFLWPFFFKLGFNLFVSTIWLTIMSWLAMALVAPFWGQAIDRFGPKPVLGASALATALTPLAWITLHHGCLWVMPIIVIVAGVVWPGIDQVSFYMQLKVFPEKRRTAFIANFFVVQMLGSMLGCSLGGVCAEFWQHHLQWLAWAPSWITQYQPVFFLSFLIRISAFLFIFTRLPLPGKARYSTVAHAIATDFTASIPESIPGAKKRRKSKQPSDIR